MSDNVIPFPRSKEVTTSPQEVLDRAAGFDLDTVILMGFRKTKDGVVQEFFGSSTPDAGVVLWLIERLKKQIL